MGDIAKAASVSMARIVDKNNPGVLKSSFERKYILTSPVRPNSMAPSDKNLIMNCL